MSLIDRNELIDAMQEWVNDKTRTSGDVLTNRRSMTIEVREQIDSMIAQQEGSVESTWSGFPLISPSNIVLVDKSVAPPNGAGASTW